MSADMQLSLQAGKYPQNPFKEQRIECSFLKSRDENTTLHLKEERKAIKTHTIDCFCKKTPSNNGLPMKKSTQNSQK